MPVCRSEPPLPGEIQDCQESSKFLENCYHKMKSVVMQFINYYVSVKINLAFNICQYDFSYLGHKGITLLQMSTD